MTTLFDPVRLGDLSLANRIVMAPLTRNRASNPGRVPPPLTATYYAQRASAGLIISEATQISPIGQGYLDTPGIYSPEQIAGWKGVTSAVHAQGGKIVLQLWHVGRISHTSLLPTGELPVAPSALRADAKTYTAQGYESVSAPRALALHELPGIVEQFRVAARHAIEAGFDGVEVHGANGYLLDQFLRSSSNQRDDAYGGSVANRARLLLEVLRSVCDEVGHGRTGVRLSPVAPFNDVSDADPQTLFNHVAEHIAPLQLAYVHVIEGETGGRRDVLTNGVPFDYAALKQRAGAPWIVNNSYELQLATDAVATGRADAVAFGRPFISNPDLVRRLRDGAPLNPLDGDTLYGGGAKGYTDYPSLDDKPAG